MCQTGISCVVRGAIREMCRKNIALIAGTLLQLFLSAFDVYTKSPILSQIQFCLHKKK